MASVEAVEKVAPITRSEAFRRLADRHLAPSYRLAYAILGNAAEAEDATHDAFVIAWRKWGSLRDSAKFEHWFDRILVNTCRNRLRRSSSRFVVRDVSAEMRSHAADPRDDYRALEDRAAIGHVMSRLSADHRIVVALRYYRDLTVDEIADRLGIPAGTVKSRLHHALRQLHAGLDDANARELLK